MDRHDKAHAEVNRGTSAALKGVERVALKPDRNYRESGVDGSENSETAALQPNGGIQHTWCGQEA